MRIDEHVAFAIVVGSNIIGLCLYAIDIKVDMSNGVELDGETLLAREGLRLLVWGLGIILQDWIDVEGESVTGPTDIIFLDILFCRILRPGRAGFSCTTDNLSFGSKNTL